MGSSEQVKTIVARIRVHFMPSWHDATEANMDPVPGAPHDPIIVEIYKRPHWNGETYWGFQFDLLGHVDDCRASLWRRVNDEARIAYLEEAAFATITRVYGQRIQHWERLRTP